MTAGRGASVVTLAVRDALVGPLAAHKVRDGQRVLRDVGFLVVAAQAAVLQCFLQYVSTRAFVSRVNLAISYRITLIDNRSSWLRLLADLGASLLLVLAPYVYARLAWLYHSFFFPSSQDRTKDSLTPDVDVDIVRVDLVLGLCQYGEGGGHSQSGRTEEHDICRRRRAFVIWFPGYLRGGGRTYKREPGSLPVNIFVLVQMQLWSCPTRI